MVNDSTGLLNLNVQFDPWKPTEHFIHTILTYIKKIFYYKEYWFVKENALNQIACELCDSDPESFMKNLDACLENQNTKLYDNENEVEIPIKEFDNEASDIMQKIKSCDSSLSVTEQTEYVVKWIKNKYLV